MDDSLTVDDVKRFEVAYNAELERGKVSSETQFSYAWCLIKGNDKTDILKGVLLLQGLCQSGTDQRDYLFFIAQGYYKLGEYKKALRWLNWPWHIGRYSTSNGWSRSIGWTCIFKSQVICQLCELTISLPTIDVFLAINK
ncbi:mitochondrial fission 1 protein-like isoform X2 [Acropora muricata]|uniref:mitochondrial fission 1 protein-like isoform X2 n=1 Tax=Acropora muricata TaxID=159855 RepID=UPI0034E5BC48